MNKSDKKFKLTFVLKNGENSLEFTSRRSMFAYYKRFCSLFPDLDKSNISMFKVLVYEIENN